MLCVKPYSNSKQRLSESAFVVKVKKPFCLCFVRCTRWISNCSICAYHCRRCKLMVRQFVAAQDMRHFDPLSNQIITQKPPMAFPVKLLCTHNCCAGCCRRRHKALNGHAEFTSCHIICVVTKSGAAKPDIKRLVIGLTVSAPTQIFKPHVPNIFFCQKLT